MPDRPSAHDLEPMFRLLGAGLGKVRDAPLGRELITTWRSIGELLTVLLFILRGVATVGFHVTRFLLRHASDR